MLCLSDPEGQALDKKRHHLVIMPLEPPAPLVTDLEEQVVTGLDPMIIEPENPLLPITHLMIEILTLHLRSVVLLQELNMMTDQPTLPTMPRLPTLITLPVLLPASTLLPTMLTLTTPLLVTTLLLHTDHILMNRGVEMTRMLTDVTPMMHHLAVKRPLAVKKPLVLKKPLDITTTLHLPSTAKHSLVLSTTLTECRHLRTLSTLTEALQLLCQMLTQ